MQLQRLDKLVVVCCHGILLDDDATFEDARNHERWTPTRPDQAQFYVKHIEKGVEIAKADPGVLLVFSGGKTREKAGNRSEAEGYKRLAEQLPDWDDVKARTETEEYARDSFENILFSLCIHKRVTSDFPRHVTVVSFGVKYNRFDLHRADLGIPDEAYTFAPVDDPLNIDDAMAREKEAIEEYKVNPYSIGGLPAQKRSRRNPFKQKAPYFASAKEPPEWFLESPALWQMLLTR